MERTLHTVASFEDGRGHKRKNGAAFRSREQLPDDKPSKQHGSLSYNYKTFNSANNLNESGNLLPAPYPTPESPDMSLGWLTP